MSGFKLSIFTLATNPIKNQFSFKVVVNGGAPLDLGPWSDKVRVLEYPWPDVWSWLEMPWHYNAGLQACTGDWILRLDLDNIIHEGDFGKLRQTLEKSDCPVASLVRSTVVNRDYKFKKWVGPFAVNGKYKDIVKFGENLDRKTDWCFPIRVEGINNKGIPVGREIQSSEIQETGVEILNYDYFFRTKEEARRWFWRGARAYADVFGPAWGSDEQSS